MKSIRAVLLMTTLLTCAATAQEPAAPAADPALLQEVRQMRIALEQIAADVAKLRENATQPSALASSWSGSSGFESRGPDLQKLAAIKLPDLADQEQVKKYVLDILAASQGQNSWSDRDPQVAMLTRVGPENVPVLLDALSLSSHMNDYHLRYAINRLADDSSKALIIAALPIYRELAEVVIRRGWENDAKQTLIDGLANPYEDLPTEWITAAVNLNDPATYPLLREYFIRGRNHYWTYEAIKDLPIEDLPGAVAQAWENSRSDRGGCDREYMAMVAMSYGHLDALADIVDMLAAEDPNNQWMMRQVRPALFRAIDFRGSHADLAKWFAAHRDRLRFDPETKKYVVTEGDQAP